MDNPVEVIKRIPPVAWLIGGAVVIGVVILSGGKSSSDGVSSAGLSGGAGGGGGAGPDTVDSLSRGFVELVEEVRAQRELDLDWQQGIEDVIAAAAPNNPNPPGSTPPPASVPTTPTPSTPTPTSIPWWMRDPTSAFRTVWGKDIGNAIRSKYTLTDLATILRLSGLKSYGTGPVHGINDIDIKRALEIQGINPGSKITVSDVDRLAAKVQ